MKLTGKVVKIESGSQFTDKQQRVVIRFKDAEGSMYDSLRVVNSNNYDIDDEIEMELSLAMQDSYATGGVNRIIDGEIEI
jgi:hypothetical protein